MLYLRRIDRILFVLAAIWSWGVAIYLLLSPTTIQEMIATGNPNGSQTVEEFTRQASWYEVQGLWGVIILLLFATLFSAVGYFGIKNELIPLALTSFLAVFLTLLAGFSIGLLYFPGAIAVLAGWIVIGIGRVFSRKNQER